MTKIVTQSHFNSDTWKKGVQVGKHLSTFGSLFLSLEWTANIMPEIDL